jgi:hypothetical protein
VNPWKQPAHRGWTLVGSAVLAAVLLGAVALAVAAGGKSPRFLEAVACAATVCLAGGIGGWVVARWPTRNPSLAVAKGLGAVSLRIFLPLLALGWLQTPAGRGLRDAGADRLLLVFYLATLATDILLHIMGARRTPQDSRQKIP